MNTPPPAPDEPDSITIRSAIEGDRTSFADLYRFYKGVVDGLVAQVAYRSGWGHEKDDLVSEIWCRLLERDRALLRYYDPARGYFRWYLHIVVRQETARVLAKKGYALRPDPLSKEVESLMDERWMPFVAALIQNDRFHKAIERIDAELDEPDRILVHEHYLRGRTLRDVANALNLSEEAIYQRNYRLKKKLLRIGEQFEPPEPPSAPSPSPATTRRVTGLLVLMLLTELGSGRLEERSGLDQDDAGARGPSSMGNDR